MTPEQRVAEAIEEADAETLDYERRSPDDGYGSHATAALDAIRDALASDDPAVVRAMAERVGLRVNTRIEYEAVCRGSLDQTGQPRSFSFGSDRANRVLEAILRRKFGLSPETHLVMCAELLTASVTVGGPWREVPDAEA